MLLTLFAAKCDGFFDSRPERLLARGKANLIMRLIIIFK